MTPPSNQINLDWHGDIVALERLAKFLPPDALAAVAMEVQFLIRAKCQFQVRTMLARPVQTNDEIGKAVEAKLRPLSKSIVASGDAHENTL